MKQKNYSIRPYWDAQGNGYENKAIPDYTDLYINNKTPIEFYFFFLHSTSASIRVSTIGIIKIFSLYTTAITKKATSQNTILKNNKIEKEKNIHIVMKNIFVLSKIKLCVLVEQVVFYGKHDKPGCTVGSGFYLLNLSLIASIVRGLSSTAVAISRVLFSSHISLSTAISFSESIASSWWSFMKGGLF